MKILLILLQGCRDEKRLLVVQPSHCSFIKPFSTEPKFSYSFVNSVCKPWINRIFCTSMPWLLSRRRVTLQFSCSSHRVLQLRLYTTPLTFMKGSTNLASGVSKQEKKKKKRERNCRYTLKFKETCPCRHLFSSVHNGCEELHLAQRSTFSHLIPLFLLFAVWKSFVKTSKRKPTNGKLYWQIFLRNKCAFISQDAATQSNL